MNADPAVRSVSHLSSLFSHISYLKKHAQRVVGQAIRALPLSYLARCLPSEVARAGVEPATSGFLADSRGLNWLLRLESSSVWVRDRHGKSMKPKPAVESACV